MGIFAQEKVMAPVVVWVIPVVLLLLNRVTAMNKLEWFPLDLSIVTPTVSLLELQISLPGSPAIPTLVTQIPAVDNMPMAIQNNKELTTEDLRKHTCYIYFLINKQIS